MVDRLALAHPPAPYDFPRPLLDDPGLDFSFSGLKTAMLYFLRDQGADVGRTPAQGLGPATGLAEEGPVLSAFFAAVSEVLVAKTLRAAERLGVEAVTVSGGLAASRKLRADFEAACGAAGLRLYYPPPRLCTDNAAMVACLAAYRYEAGRFDDLALEGYPNLPM